MDGERHADASTLPRHRWRGRGKEFDVSERVPIFLYARDPILEAGLASQLRHRPEVEMVGDGRVDEARVAVVVADGVDEETVRVLRALQRNGVPRLVLVASILEGNDLVAVVEAGVSGVLWRSEATIDRLLAVILSAAAGEGTVPPDLLGRLLDQVGRLQRQVLDPRGFTFAGLSGREIEVLRLVADGHETKEIAARLCYSERTVKNVLHEITTRLQLRNRSHAVAYAMREGLI
jgi:DNA-binding NarL/FixJ family response regulator